MKNTPKLTTPGEWIVTTTMDEKIAVVQISETHSILKVIAVFGDADSENLNEHLANAALVSISKEMLDALIAIQESVLNPACEEVDLIAINEMISNIFAKLANEADEEI